MSIRTLTGAAALAALLITAASPTAVLAGPAPGDVGTPAADFDLDIFPYNSGSMTLSEHSGKVVLLFIIGYA